MAIERSLLLTRVGRRIVLLFALCALVPIGVLAAISIYQGSRELQSEAEDRLREQSKGRAMRIAERLALLENEIVEIAVRLDQDPSLLIGDWSAGLAERVGGRIRSLALQVPELGAVPVLAELEVPELTEGMQRQLFEKGRAIAILPTREEGPRAPVLLACAVPVEGEQIAVWAALEPHYLWYGPGEGDTLSEGEILWIVGPDGALLHPSDDPTAVLPASVQAAIQSTNGNAEWEDELGKRWISGHFALPLQAQYMSPHLPVILSQSRNELLAPVAAFQKSLGLVAIASVWIVLLLSLSQIRKSLTPLKKLSEGTKQIAERNFAARVEIGTKDEFAELGDSFNAMASRLGQQFTTLSSLHRIAGAGLAADDAEALAVRILRDLGATFAYRPRLLTILAAEDTGATATYYCTGGKEEQRPHVTSRALAAEEMRVLAGGSMQVLGPPRGSDSFLAPLDKTDCRCFLALPVALDGELAAVLAIGFKGKPPDDVDSARQLRQIAEQVGAAIAHVRLFMHIQRLYRGTLRALSLTIDAKSRWTQGHSERVTRMAVRLARELRLREVEVQIIDRGGQLHDIGKIGVPGTLLDKPGKLSAEERKKIEEHTLIGERILEPIPGFEDVIPIVGQHHEWWSGGGYPRGLKGNEIHYYARILAVADTYDALRSDRPYRGAIPRPEVVNYIANRAGTQFDPVVVEAFLRVVPLQPHQTAASPVVYL